ncbi:MAG: PKD domain-containing protein, partial [Pricia sp.]|nr:PKD domain-containing protein [Pricia sp.]
VLGPEGLDEINLTKASGNYGWPYFSGADNDPYQITYTNPTYYNDPAAPVNNSVWNTGVTNLPPAEPAWLEKFHRCYLAGFRYNYDPNLTDDQRLPAEFDDMFFYYDFNRSMIWAVEMDAAGNILSDTRLAPSVFPSNADGFIDMEVGPDGKMYILAYGAGCCPDDVGTGRLIRVDYTGITTNSPPNVVLEADVTNGPLPLTVNFTGDKTTDPNGDSPLTFAWDFDVDGTVDSTEENPTFTYTEAGTFTAQLKVDDGQGGIGARTITIYAGNSITDFEFASPPDGGLFGWNDDFDLNLTANDPDEGDIPCSEINVIPSLGHLNHFHDDATIDACTTTLTLDDGGHDIDGEMDIYFVLNANYTDTGGLISRDQIRLHPKRKEAEYYDTQSGTTKIPNSAPLEGGSEALQVDNNGYISFAGRNLLNINAVKYLVASDNAGSTIEFRLGSPTGTLIATTSVPSTGGNDEWVEVQTPITNPGGKNDLFFVFKNASAPQDIFRLNYVEFIGTGVSTDNSPPLVNTVKATSNSQVTVFFSEYVSQATAETAANYTVDNGVNVISAELQSDNRTVILTTSSLSSGVDYTLTVSNVQNISGISVATDTYTFSVFNEIRINAGGPEITLSGNIFAADQFNLGGASFSQSVPIDGTNEDELYQTERYATGAGGFGYEIPVSGPGDYDIRLHFAEIFFGVAGGDPSGGVGSRVFNVVIEGNQVLTNFDILSETNPATVLLKEFDNISITDGFASILFNGIEENPKINGIEILSPDTFNGNGANDADITITSPSNGWDVNQPFEVAFRVENWIVNEGDTHLHYFIDDVMVDRYYGYEPIPIDGLSLGEHTIKVELFNADHTGTGIFDEVTVNVTAAITCNETPFPDSWAVHTFDANPYVAVYTFADFDFDGDGLKDIVTGGWWYKNPGSASGNWVKNTIGGNFGNVVHVHDFDGDGDMDLLGTALGISPDEEYESAQLLWARNDDLNSGNFTVFTNVPAGDTNYSEPFVAGLAGGVFSVGGPYQMAINWNGAEQTNSPVQMLTPTADPTTGTWSLVDISPDSSGEDMQAGDIDRDGDLDLFQGDIWLRNNGGGNFETFSTGITYASTPDRAQLADFDRDGDLDAVVGQLGAGGTGNQSEFAWFAAPADPTQPWVRNVLDADIDGSLSVFAVDIDFDGDKDIVVGEWLGNHRLIAFENDLCGSGEFNLRTIDEGALDLEHHDGARVTDIDNDGDLDVISNGWRNDLVPRIYENTTAQPDDDKPIANAGQDRTVLPPSVTLNGSGSDPDGGEIMAFQWTQQSGPNTAILSGNATEVLTASELVDGVYVFRLTVTDDENDTGFDEVTITVTTQASTVRINSGGPSFTFEENNWSADQYNNGGLSFTSAIPIANTTNDQLYQTERYRTSGSLIYEIPVANGEHSVNLHFAEIFHGLPGDGASGGAGSRVFNIDVEGQEQLENYDIFVAAGGAATAVIETFNSITVTDQSLTIVLSPVTEFPKISGIEVLSATDPGVPTVDAGDDQTITLPTNSTVLTALGDDPDGGSISYVWTQVSGPSDASLSGAATAEVSVSEMTEGVYVFQVTVTDDENETAFDQVSVTVVPAGGLLAIAEASPTSGSSPLEVSFTGSNSVGDITAYLWDFKDGNTSTDADPANTFAEDGIYEVELTVTGSNGTTNTSSITITVSPEVEDELMAVAEASPTQGEIPLLVNFTGDMSTGDIDSYLWDFKDGNTSMEANPSHTFANIGTYDVELTVTDAGGLSDTAIVTIIVTTVDNGEVMGVLLEQNPSQNGIAKIRVLN